MAAHLNQFAPSCNCCGCCAYTGDLTVTFSGCDLLDGMTRTLFWTGTSWLSGVEAADGGFECNCGEEDVDGIQIALTCTDGTWTATIKDLFCITSISFTIESASCGPVYVVASATIETEGDGCCGTTTPTITLTFTE
jgi:hypothetical protein